MAQLIKATGETAEVEPKNGKDFSLDELNKFVNGYIELVLLADKRYMVVNEEGLLLNLPPNMIASYIAGQYIVGDVLVCDKKQIK